MKRRRGGQKTRRRIRVGFGTEPDQSLRIHRQQRVSARPNRLVPFAPECRFLCRFYNQCVRRLEDGRSPHASGLITTSLVGISRRSPWLCLVPFQRSSPTSLSLSPFSMSHVGGNRMPIVASGFRSKQLKREDSLTGRLSLSRGSRMVALVSP
jgi:hypothetical protein